GAPCAVVVAVRLVDEIEVDVVCLQSPAGLLKGLSCGLFPGIVYTQLRDDEQVFPFRLSLLYQLSQSPPHRLLISVGGRCIKHAVSALKGLPHAPDTRRRVLHAEHTESQERHFHSISQSYRVHRCLPPVTCNSSPVPVK